MQEIRFSQYGKRGTSIIEYVVMYLERLDVSNYT